MHGNTKLKLKQNLTLTEVAPLRQTMYWHSQQSICFWNRYNFAWPRRPEPSRDRTVPTTAVCSISGAFWESSYLIRTALPRPVQLTKQARPLPSTYHISFVLWYHSNLAPKEHLSPVLSSAKQRVCLQSPVYLSLPSAAQLVTLVIATVTGDRSSKIFRETTFNSTCHLSLPHQSSCHLSHSVAKWNRPPCRRRSRYFRNTQETNVHVLNRVRTRDHSS
jgi:hypothetical protein